MQDWQATRAVILQAESIENHFAQQKLLKPTLVYQHNMSVITTTLSTLHFQLQNTMHAMLGQREEKMISDKAHAIDMRLFDLEWMLDRARTDEERSPIIAKMKHLQETR
jgi:hypothetical protein